MKANDKMSLNAYLFSVDILIEEESNAKAFEKLLHLLNRSDASDFRVQKGVELGKVIDQYIQGRPQQNVIISGNKPKSTAEPSPGDTPKPAKQSLKLSVKEEAPAKSKSSVSSAPNASSLAVDDRIRWYIAGNRLIRLHVNKGLGIKLSIPCRIISFDVSKQLLTVYHVDEKQVYTFTINEIDDFIE